MTDEAGQTLFGAAAMEKLYNTFLSLQGVVDVSDPLSHISQMDHVLLSAKQTMDGNTYPLYDCTYDCYGSKKEMSFTEAIANGQPIYFHYDKSGNVQAVTVWGLVYGYPNYDEKGKLTALDVPSSDTGNRYTSPVTLDANGNITRIEIPFVLNEGAETGCHQVYEFLYDAGGKLMQYTSTKYSTGGTYESTSFYKENGFYEKAITQCLYDTAGKLITTLTHNDYTNASGQGLWSYQPTQYAYDAEGLLSARIIDSCTIHYSGFTNAEKEEMDRIHDALFQHSGLVDTIAQEFLNMINGRLSIEPLVTYEYEYGSIYIYTP